MKPKQRPKDEHIVINLSGRGDKDIFNVAKAFQDDEFVPFIQDYADQFNKTNDVTSEV